VDIKTVNLNPYQQEAMAYLVRKRQKFLCADIHWASSFPMLEACRQEVCLKLEN